MHARFSTLTVRPPRVCSWLALLAAALVAVFVAAAAALAYIRARRVTPIIYPSRPVRTVEFSGYEFWVKQSASPVGPGPNRFGGGPDNVWVDARGRLHLKITHLNNLSRCAEVVLTHSLGHGTYRFYLDAPAPSDPNVVLGLFTWKVEPAYAHREIDIELSRWAQPGIQDAQFVVQPFQRPGHRVRFELPANVSQSVQSFTWSPGRVTFKSWTGQSVVHTATLTSAIPVPGGENPRINLWLCRPDAPTNAPETEMVISKFEFVPLAGEK